MSTALWVTQILAAVAGAAGLILPAATGVAPVLTPIAAVCLMLLMAGAIATHRSLHENVTPAAVVALVCVGIVVGHVTKMWPNWLSTTSNVASP